MQVVQLRPRNTRADNKREYLAAVALQGLLASGDRGPKQLAARAVEYADALTAALEA